MVDHLLETRVKYKELYDYGWNEFDRNALKEAFAYLNGAIAGRKTIYLIGNGGSAAIANHFATDFFKGVNTNTLCFPRVQSLATNEALLTAIGNDIGFEQIFSYQLESLLQPGDIVIAISSSGNSLNIQNAVKEAHVLEGVTVIGISGFKANNWLNENADVAIHFPIFNYGVVEDLSSSLLHILSQSLRKEWAKPYVDISGFTF